jgi:hypothetical protein
MDNRSPCLGSSCIFYLYCIRKRRLNRKGVIMNRKIFGGMLFVVGVQRVFQDIMGKEAYEMVTGWFSLPIACFIILYSLYLMRNKN